MFEVGRSTSLCSFQGVRRKRKGAEPRGEATESGSQEARRISGDNSLRDPPVPIPNTEVKPQHADGTWLATARESRSSPDSILFGQPVGAVLFFGISFSFKSIYARMCINAGLGVHFAIYPNEK